MAQLHFSTYWEPDLHVVRKAGTGIVVVLQGAQLLLILIAACILYVPDKVFLKTKLLKL